MVVLMLLTGRTLGFHTNRRPQQLLTKTNNRPRPLSSSMAPSHHHRHQLRSTNNSPVDRGLVCVRGEDDGTGPQEGDPYDDLRPDFEFDAVTMTAVAFGLIAFNFFVLANL